MDISKASIQAFRKDFAAAVVELEKKYGVKIQLGTISFTSSEFHGKLMAENPINPVEVERKAREEFQAYAQYFDLKPEWFGKVFTIPNAKEPLKVNGLMMNKPKNCVSLVGVVTGKLYQCPALTLISAMRRKEAFKK